MPEGNPFGYGGGERALRERVLQMRSEASGIPFGPVSNFDPPPLSTGKRILNAIGGRELGIQPFAQAPAALPRITLDDVRAGHPQAEQYLASLNPTERFLLFAENPEALIDLAGDSGPLFEQLFGDFPGITDPTLRRTAELERQQASGGIRLPRGAESLDALEGASALEQAQDDTMRAMLEASYFAQRGVLPEAAAVRHIQRAHQRAEADAATAALGPAKAQADIAQSRGAAASSFASARKTGIEAEQAARGPLLVFLDPATNEPAGTAYENDEAAAAMRQRGLVPLKVGSFAIQSGSTAAALGEPAEKERQDAGAALRSQAGLGAEISAMLEQVAASPRAFGPIADAARESRLLAGLNTLSPDFVDSTTKLLTSMDQAEFSQFRTRIDLLTRQYLPVTTQEKSRFSEPEQRLNEKLTGTAAGTSVQAYIGKLKALRDFQVLNEDKLAIIAGAPGDEYGDLDDNRALGALGTKLTRLGYRGKEKADLMAMIYEQRDELRRRGAEALGGRLEKRAP
jgi:hypothetical protein